MTGQTKMMKRQSVQQKTAVVGGQMSLKSRRWKRKRRMYRNGQGIFPHQEFQRVISILCS